jgi:hypothetical protein
MLKNAEGIAKIKIDSVCHCKQTKVVIESRKVNKLGTENSDLIKPWWEKYNLDV